MRQNRRHCRQVSDVGLTSDHPAPCSLDQASRLCQVVRRCRSDSLRDGARNVHRDDVGPLLSQTNRVRTPQTTRSARDESDLALYPTTHEVSGQ